MGLRNMDLGGNRLGEFDDLAQHTILEMPSCNTVKIYDGQLLSNHNTLYAGSGRTERPSNREWKNGRQRTDHFLIEVCVSSCVSATRKGDAAVMETGCG